jgi:hypothetical protein
MDKYCVLSDMILLSVIKWMLSRDTVSEPTGGFEWPADNLSVSGDAFVLSRGKAPLPCAIPDQFGREQAVTAVLGVGSRTRGGKRVEKLPGMLTRLQQMIVEFLGVVQAAHLSFLEAQPLDALATSTVRGEKRVAGVDLQKPRMRTVAEAVVAVAATPGGFTSAQLADRVRAQQADRWPATTHAKPRTTMMGHKACSQAEVIRFSHIRKANLNPRFDKESAAMTLWKSEMLELVEEHWCHRMKGAEWVG